MTQRQLSVSGTYDNTEFLKVTESGDDIKITMHVCEEEFDIYASRDDFFKFTNKLQKFKSDQK